MYGITDIKKGALVQIDDKPYRVIEYSQKVMGRGGSVVNVRLKNLIDGAVIPKTFHGNDKLEPAHIEGRKVQYLYNDGQNYFFMDGKTFEQFELPISLVEEIAPYLVEGFDEVDLQSFNGRIINAEIPNNLYLKVTHAENVVKGDTTSSVLKDATLETGLVVKVPAFIKTGEVIKVDTRSGEYLERKK